MTASRPFAPAYLAVLVGAFACRSSPPPAAAPGPASDVLVAVNREAFSPKTGDAALRAFVPDVAPVDSGGECTVTHTPGSSATIVIAFFPSRAAVRTQINITFDSSGRLVRYSDRRGMTRIPSTKAMTPAQRDSTFRATADAIRSTTINLDYAGDQGIVMNRGGGRPTDAILGPVRAIEKLPALGPPTARLDRARRLCGV